MTTRAIEQCAEWNIIATNRRRIWDIELATKNGKLALNLGKILPKKPPNQRLRTLMWYVFAEYTATASG